MKRMGGRPNTLMDSLDLIFLGTIGLGTIAWLARKKLFGSSSSTLDKTSFSNSTTTANSSTPTKPERNFVKVMQQQGRKCIVFYGSQTGTAEDYATRLAKECSQKYGVSAMAADIELYDLSYMDTVPEDYIVFFIMATYGEGEPTDNAVDFWELLNNETPQFSEMGNDDKPLKNVRYVVFGLGNKTYEHYNSVGRTVDKQMQKLGATRIGERGEGDDDGSLEEDFLAWQESMWPAFCEALGVDESAAQSGPRQATFGVEELTDVDEALVYHGELAERPKTEGIKIIYDAKRPYNAPITTREIFQDGGERHCIHVDIDISGTNLNYQTGDHVAIWPTNNEAEVNRLASVLGLSNKLDTTILVKAIDPTASKQYPFPAPTTYRAIFRHYTDICSIPSRQALMALVEYAPNEQAKSALLKLASDKDEYRVIVSDAVRNLGEVLTYVVGVSAEGAFAGVPFDLVVESLSRLQPRYYSISSSAKESPTKISATCVTLEYHPEPTPERTVYGVNTNYLWQIHSKVHNIDDGRSYPLYALDGPRGALMSAGVRIPVHVRRSQFKLPRNSNVPVIMVGPGTGVAPFRGFVRERALQKKEGKSVGPTILFFGCRHSQKDFLYADEWPALFETLGEDSQLITAFSRETDHKVYVQHRLQEHGQQMWEYILQGAYIYVCGDAKNMARDVQQAFVAFAQTHGGKDEEKANAFIKQLRTSGRYQEDVWS
ncbi:uncharacterized protein BX664DRAFT_384075 [Halteromyces radiatus]|uniref:uncharacterized protein n=1 Tax=Halteromyces radiatus TaxID=101107 RepID=UPI0022204090|nr:uncharacterized protein BX664DRAFT_384075 [Halteromyces radiatus]KAI8092523.1 hypothetical protein BX664DRAFT_384075 [Halteromyces radiatus]